MGGWVGGGMGGWMGLRVGFININEDSRRRCPGHTAWEKLDELGPHSLCHDLERDRHVFGSYVTGHLPREHPHVADTNHDDRAEEGVFLGNDRPHQHFGSGTSSTRNHADE